MISVASTAYTPETQRFAEESRKFAAISHYCCHTPFAYLKVVLPICEIFRSEKTQLFSLTIIRKLKAFILELSLNNSKFFRTKFRRLPSVKQP